MSQSRQAGAFNSLIVCIHVRLQTLINYNNNHMKKEDRMENETKRKIEHL